MKFTLLKIAVWLLAIVATVAAFRYGLPPKHGPATNSIWWFPIAFPLFLLLGDPTVGMVLALCQFPALAALMVYGLGKWPMQRVVVVSCIAYLSAVALCAGIMKLIEMIARR